MYSLTPIFLGKFKVAKLQFRFYSEGVSFPTSSFILLSVSHLTAVEQQGVKQGDWLDVEQRGGAAGGAAGSVRVQSVSSLSKVTLTVRGGQTSSLHNLQCLFNEEITSIDL